MKRKLSEKQHQRLFKLRDEFISSIRDFFTVKILLNDLDAIEQLVKTYKEFMRKQVKAARRRK